MRYLLDTNVCVMYLNGRSTSVRDRLLSVPLEDMAVCSVVKAELLYYVPYLFVFLANDTFFLPKKTFQVLNV